MYGLFLMVEAVRQLRGQAGARQLTGPKIALCHGNGGALSSQATVLFGTEAALRQTVDVAGVSTGVLAGF